MRPVELEDIFTKSSALLGDERSLFLIDITSAYEIEVRRWRNVEKSGDVVFFSHVFLYKKNTFKSYLTALKIF